MALQKTAAVWLGLSSLALLVGASPVALNDPLITPAPTVDEPTKVALHQRGIIDHLSSDVNGVLSKLGSAIPSYVASGVPNFFQDFPSGDKVESSLGINHSELQALPTSVLNIPPYGNWSNDGWNVRFRGNVYKQPNTAEKKLDELANVFLIGVDIKDLPADQQNNARNVTSSIFVVQQKDENVTMNLVVPVRSQVFNQKNGSTQSIQLKYPTTEEGDFDVFTPIKLDGLEPGNKTTKIQQLSVHAEGAVESGNATAYLVPPKGLTVISDIDDILRVTKIYAPKEGLLNSFARPFVPWMDMPSIYANWSKSLPDTHFHYLTTTPEQITRNYMDFIYKTYPAGSFDTRPLNFSDVQATLSIRKFLLDKIFETFPERKFILVADTSNSDVMRDYPQLAHDHPEQVQCIFLRNTSATDDADKFPYDTKGFKGLNQSMYMFFKVPEDLANLDIAAGHCYNSTIPQNVTFGLQDELLGIHGSGAALGSKPAGLNAVALVVALTGLFLSL